MDKPEKIPVLEMREYLEFCLVDRCLSLERYVEELKSLLENSKRYNDYLKKENDLAREVQRKKTEELHKIKVKKNGNKKTDE